MAVNSIVTQPAALVAAYRPIVFRVNVADLPPVVYCDIYFGGTYYKTISRTQYDVKNIGDADFVFDISDAAQEYLRYQLPVNGGTDYLVPSNVFTECFCRFRSSAINVDGFLTPEGTAPIQGTSSSDPVAGDGTESGDFTIINATLQHEDNQDLRTHLESYRAASGWDPDAMPLTHRPNPYKICRNDSDYFPFVDFLTRVYRCIVLYYKLKGDADFSDTYICGNCVNVSVGGVFLPDAFLDIPYSYEFTVSGSEPFDYINDGIPSWMTISITGSTVTLSGTPDASGEVSVAFRITNCDGTGSLSLSQNINISECVAPVIGGDGTIDPGVVGVPYLFVIPLSGSAPFTLSGETRPGWMTIALVGSEVHLYGTPESDGTFTVAFGISNCADTGDTFGGTIDVAPADNYTLSPAYSTSIDSVTGTGVPALGPTSTSGDVTGIHTAMSGSYSVDVTTSFGLPLKIVAYVNGSEYSSVAMSSGSGTYSLSIVASGTDDVKISINLV